MHQLVDNQIKQIPRVEVPIKVFITVRLSNLLQDLFLCLNSSYKSKTKNYKVLTFELSERNFNKTQIDF